MPAQFSSWDSYFWEPGGPVLRNLYGERDGDALAQREYAETSAQQFDIERGAVAISRTYDAAHLRAIHKQLFGNVYEWAGQYRTVSIRKNLSEFAHPSDVSKYVNDASRLVHAAGWSTMDRDQFAAAAAEVFAYVNQAHPFREGNGRTAKLFLQHVSELSPYRIDYSPAVCGVTPEMWNQASMLSGPDLGTYAPVPASLVPVFRAMTVERAPVPPRPDEEAWRGVELARAGYPTPATGAGRDDAPGPSASPGPASRGRARHRAGDRDVGGAAR